MEDERIDIEFEQIVPWNGANDTGRDVRLKWQRNFERVKTSMQALEQQIEQAGDVHEQDLDRVLTQSKEYTDRQVEAGVVLAVETANQYTDVQIEAVRKDMDDLDDKYLRKDREDTAHAHITFEEGITVQGLATLMRLDVPELATIAQAVVQMMRSTRFVDGFAGEGYQIWKDIATGDWSMTLDRLTVRKVMTIYELIVQKIRSVGGMVVVSAANGKIKAVRREGSQYVLTFEDDNQFQPHDLMRCQVFSSSGLKYYWVEVQAVDGEEVRVPVSEFGGVMPVSGDEVVLMGNTANKLRQNLILISATEDGQPRFDCLDGVSTKSFEGCLKVRVGALDGISDSRFPADLQPQGYGLYGNNCYLTGVFVLSNGKDVLTMFQITEGLIKSEISSVRQEINEQDNYLSNASFTSSMLHWQYGQDIRVFTVSNRLLMFNHNLYSRKDAFAGIYDEGIKNVLRVKKSYILQLNDELQRHPEFTKEKKETLDEETGEVTGSEEGYRALSIYVSFRYRVLRPGTLSVRFVGESTTGFFDYDPLAVSMELEPTEEWQTMELSAKWSGTGDFRLDFTGDMYLYDLAVSDNRLADVEEQYRSKFELTDKRLEVAFERIKKNTGSIEQYRSEFLQTADQILLSVSSDVADLNGKIEANSASISIQAGRINSLVEWSDGVDSSISSLEQTASSISSTVASNKAAADAAIKAAQDAADSAKRAASDAQDTADSASSAAGDNATAILQTNNAISALAGKFSFNDNGEITNYSKSGLVLTSNYATLFSEQMTAQGLVKKADISTFVTENEVGDLISNATIRADQINLTGHVTFNMLESGLQNTISGKANASSLGSMAYEDSVSKAMLDDTLISGGYIRTSLIDVDNLVTKRLVADNATSRYEIDWNGLTVYDAITEQSTLFIRGASNGSYCTSYIMLFQRYTDGGDVYQLRLHPDRIQFVKNGTTIKSIYAEDS